MWQCGASCLFSFLALRVTHGNDALEMGRMEREGGKEGEQERREDRDKKQLAILTTSYWSRLKLNTP